MPAGQLTVLLIEDQEVDAELLRRHLQKLSKWQFEVIHKTDPQAALRELCVSQIDLVILDYILESTTGFEVLRAIREAGHICPVIMLTGQGDESVAAELIRAGVDDYLNKSDMRGDLLRRAIEKALVQYQQRVMVRELMQRNEQIEILSEQLSEANLLLARVSRIDALTKVYNRGAWQESTELEHERSVRYGHPYGVLMIDVDHFKQYNDTYGHQAGDECLRRVAGAITETCRAIDLVGRFGGEEFVVLAPETDFECALVLAKRIQTALSELRLPHSANSASPNVTVSIGISDGPQGGWEAALKAADEALYDAKRNGRNKVCGRQSAAQLQTA